MKSEALLQWFNNEILPKLVKSGKFSENGESQTLDKCEFEAVESYVSSFASVACFAKIYLKTPSGVVSRDVLIKFQSQDELFRKRMRMVPQYNNEVTVYNEFYECAVQFLKSCGQQEDFISKVVPKCYFASDGGGDVEKAVLILQDLRADGYRLSDSVLDLDLKHCLLSVEKLAEFHSISFAMKLKDWKPLDKFKQSFVDIWMEDIPICREQCEDFMGYVSNRGIDYLLGKKDSEVPGEYLNKLKKMLEPIWQLQKSLRNPIEPLGIICHGDFNRNNILYRYVNGEVVDARLIDYQRVIYGSPSLDLGFLFYMNTTLEFRQQHFDRIFEHYYRTLVKNVSMIVKLSEELVEGRLPLQAFKEDFERMAIIHYTIVSFFVPIMMYPDEDFESDLKYKTYKQMAKKNYEKGGDVVSRRISDMIVDFYRRKFYM